MGNAGERVRQDHQGKGFAQPLVPLAAIPEVARIKPSLSEAALTEANEVTLKGASLSDAAESGASVALATGNKTSLTEASVTYGPTLPEPT